MRLETLIKGREYFITKIIIYKYYHKICKKLKKKTLTDNQFSFYLHELIRNNLIHSKLIGLGRGKGVRGVNDLEKKVYDVWDDMIDELLSETGISRNWLFNKNLKIVSRGSIEREK